MRVYQGAVRVEGVGPPPPKETMQKGKIVLVEVGMQQRPRYGVETDFGPTQYA